MGSVTPLRSRISALSLIIASGTASGIAFSQARPQAFANPGADAGCSKVAQWSMCDLSFDLAPQDNAATAELHGEFRSPRHKTYLLYAFRDRNRLVIRFSPTEPGIWDYRLTSNVARLDGQSGQIKAAESLSPGFVHPANYHHFQTEGDAKQHLWMASSIARFTALPRSEFNALVDRRAQEKFTHLRVSIDSAADLNEAAERIGYINSKGIIADVVLAAIPLEPRARESYLADLVPRFAAFNITWALGAGPPASGFEDMPHGRSVLKDAGRLIQKFDPYAHPRTAIANSTSGPLIMDGWMNILSYGTPDPNIGAVEHQLYQMPALNTGIQSQRDLWTATMNGQYAASGDGPYMKTWFEILSASRYWELEPYFDVDGGRALALEGTEYLVYVEKPALVELTVEKHSYDVAWINPATGEMIKEKGFNAEHFTGEPPDKSHDWILRVSREGRKEGMLKSYKFDSRRADDRPEPIQEVEQNPQKVPFEIGAPEGEEISLSKPAKFAVKTKRETRATRFLLCEWTAEVVADGEGYRVAGLGPAGELHIPSNITNKLPGAVLLRLWLLNANGKAYTVDKVYRLVH